MDPPPYVGTDKQAWTLVKQSPGQSSCPPVMNGSKGESSPAQIRGALSGGIDGYDTPQSNPVLPGSGDELPAYETPPPTYHQQRLFASHEKARIKCNEEKVETDLKSHWYSFQPTDPYAEAHAAIDNGLARKGPHESAEQDDWCGTTRHGPPIHFRDGSVVRSMPDTLMIHSPPESSEFWCRRQGWKDDAWMCREDWEEHVRRCKTETAYPAERMAGLYLLSDLEPELESWVLEQDLQSKRPKGIGRSRVREVIMHLYTLQWLRNPHPAKTDNTPTGFDTAARRIFEERGYDYEGYGDTKLTFSATKPWDGNGPASQTTQVMPVHGDTPAEEVEAALKFAVLKLKQGHFPVAFPTETVYGLGADATSSYAIKGVFNAKRRPQDNPLIVHFSSLQHVQDFLTARLPAIYMPLMEIYWPGPLTVILPSPAGSSLTPEVTANLRTFGARVPGNEIARRLIKAAGVPIAAPSANTSGRPSPTTAQHVLQDMKGRIGLILDGGPCQVGLESTVVDGLSEDGPVILRPGGVSIEQIRACPGWENVKIAYEDSVGKKTGPPRAPGMKYKHYSPKAPVTLYESGVPFAIPTQPNEQRLGVVSTGSWNLKELSQLTDSSPANLPVGEHSEASESFPVILQLGPGLEQVAHKLFWALRELDDRGCESIHVEGVPETEPMAAAIMNRLRKAATTIIRAPA